MEQDDELEALAFQQQLEEQQKKKESDNMAFWDRVKKTDPARVKPITGKQYKGNSPQPYYLVERMTQEFGMCGIGWGLEIISERMERLTDTDVLHIANVRLWFFKGPTRGVIEQVGQTKAAYKTSKGIMMVDEDAPKKSITDAMTKCMSYLGFAGDIFSGMWDDSKYVQEVHEEFSKARAEKQRAEMLKTAGEAINVADSLENLKAIFASWWLNIEVESDRAVLKAAYDKRKEVLSADTFEKEKE